VGARTKLNAACVNGCLVVEALAGLAARGWGVFLAALAVTLVGACYTGEIRPARRDR
jgi:hypothetical protein